MPINRRSFLKSSAAIPFIGKAPSLEKTEKNLIKPPALKRGDMIGIVCPAYSAFLREEVENTIESLNDLGFHVKLGSHIFDRYGYLAGNDLDRAADINDMFADDEVNAILAMHGGWGSARILPLLDYQLIRKNPKILIGYSDITSLLLAIYQKTNLMTVHGPVGASNWNSFSVNHFQNILMNGSAVKMKNPVLNQKKENISPKNLITNITNGEATGQLIGGNLTVFSHLLGTPYMPDCDGAILFLEDVHEDIYKIDRMITHLKLAGVLDKISGFVFGQCTECKPSNGTFGSLTLEDIWHDHIAPLNIPAFAGAMIGHIEDKFTMPIGVQATIDAKLGIITLNESAVDF